MILHRRLVLVLLFLLVSGVQSRSLFAYPSSERGQLSLTDVTAQATQMQLTSDNRYLYLGFNNKVKIVDMGTFAISSTQPYDFGSETKYSGVVGGIALSNTKLYVSQDDGDLLSFNLSDVTAEPTTTEISSGTDLGKLAINTAMSRLYILDDSNDDVFVYTIGTSGAVPIALEPAVTGASLTDMILAGNVSGGNDYVYIGTNKGSMFYIIDGQTGYSQQTVAGSGDNLSLLAARPTKDYIYAVKSGSQPTLYVVSSTSLSVSETVPLIMYQSGSTVTYNESPSGIVSTSVTNPTSYYTFVAGLSGVSVLNSSNDLIDADTSGTYTYNPIPITGSRYGPMLASTDGYIYMSNSGGSISVITDNPYLTVPTVTYSGGGSFLGVGGSATITYQSDESGTYSVLVGGSIDRSGTALLDTSGSSTGSVTASTDTTFTFNYNDNSSKLDEGLNTVFIFVTDSSSNVGRRATTVTVDTPPPAVTVNRTGFGNEKIYVFMNRLTQSDISYYNFYVSTDADAVVNKTVTPQRVNQPSSTASEMKVELGGVANDTLYYISVEAVDAAGNVGTLTTTFSSGARITGTPQYTVGPAELMGEKGCSLISRSEGHIFRYLFVLCFILGILSIVRFKRTRE